MAIEYIFGSGIARQKVYTFVTLMNSVKSTLVEFAQFLFLSEMYHMMVSPHVHQHTLSSHFLIFANLIGKKLPSWYR